MSKSSKSMLKKCVELCASKYNFNAEEAWLMIESSGTDSSKGSKGSKSSSKSSMPLPYNGENDSKKCNGLNKNHGLYTQCSSSRKEGEAYCSKCSKQALKNQHGLPDFGHIDARARCYERGEEFVDPSGKKPMAFLKVMNKLKLTEEQVLASALEQGVKLDVRHFLAKKSGRPVKEKVEKAPKESKAKGRPKKSKKVLELAGEEEDLFASLVMSANSSQLLEKVEQNVEENVEQKVEVVVEEKVKKAPKVKELSEEEKAAKAAKDALAEQKKVEKEQKAALAQQKKAEKEQKVEQKVEQKKVEKIDDDDRPTPVFVSPPDDTDVVKKILFEGKKYLKSKNTGIIYNMEQDVVGKWNEEKERIDFDEGEESEDEYDEDE